MIIPKSELMDLWKKRLRKEIVTLKSKCTPIMFKVISYLKPLKILKIFMVLVNSMITIINGFME
jgi:hypothetical protein